MTSSEQFLFFFLNATLINLFNMVSIAKEAFSAVSAALTGTSVVGVTAIAFAIRAIRSGSSVITSRSSIAASAVAQHPLGARGVAGLS